MGRHSPPGRRHGARGQHRGPHAKKSLGHRSPAAPQAQASWRWRSSTAAAHPRPGLALPCAQGGAGAQVDWPRTLAAKGAAALDRAQLRWRRSAQRAPLLHLIALDTSGSMQRSGRLAQAKGYAARLIEQAARAGEHVALLAFGGQGVALLLPPGPARASGVARVRPLAGGGGTPLAACLQQAQALLAQALRAGRCAGGCLWLLTDGRTLESPAVPQLVQLEQLVLVDFDDPLRPAGHCARWAEAWGADYRLPGCP